MSTELYATLFLNKVINERDITQLTRYQISIDDMPTKTDRDTLEFIQTYYSDTKEVPSYAVVASNVEGFTHVPEISDSFFQLARHTKDTSAKHAVVKLLNDRGLGERLNDLSGEDFIDALQTSLSDITRKTSVTKKRGTSLINDYEKYNAEYDKRRNGEANRRWKSKFPSVNDVTGGYSSGNVYTFFGRPGRGKSVVTMEEIIEMAANGANVLVWSMEMTWYEWIARAYTSLSARFDLLKAEVDGSTFSAGFDANKLRDGKLSDEELEAFREFQRQLATGELISGHITLRSVTDEDFDDRSVKALESDIKDCGADVVLIDPIYYMDYEKNTSKTAGGDAAATSMAFRRLAGRADVVMIIITQADESDEKREDGVRQIDIPSRKDVKKTKAVLEDSTIVFAFDSAGKQGFLRMSKSRNGGEDTDVEVMFMPGIGVVRELDLSELLTEVF